MTTENLQSENIGGNAAYSAGQQAIGLIVSILICFADPEPLNAMLEACERATGDA